MALGALHSSTNAISTGRRVEGVVTVPIQYLCLLLLATQMRRSLMTFSVIPSSLASARNVSALRSRPIQHPKLRI
jgi:hypothetical protein